MALSQLAAINPRRIYMKRSASIGLATLGVAMLALAGWTLRAGSDETTADKVALDQPVAPFTLPNYDGKKTRVGDWDADNTKATIVMFVATRCPVSNGYNTRMVSLAKGYKKRGVRFFGINSNKAELAPEVAEHAKNHGFTFPILKDTGNVIADRFEAGVTPEAYVIDAKGVLRYHGRIDDSLDEAGITTRDLQAALDAILDGKPVAVKKTTAFGCSIKRVEKS
jgi:peroxiredoxin